MLLIEGEEGTVLYTGDFRFDMGMTPHISALHDSSGDVKHIDALYCDTTFLNLRALKIPSRYIWLISLIDTYDTGIIICCAHLYVSDEKSRGKRVENWWVNKMQIMFNHCYSDCFKLVPCHIHCYPIVNLYWMVVGNKMELIAILTYQLDLNKKNIEIKELSSLCQREDDYWFQILW